MAIDKGSLDDFKFLNSVSEDFALSAQKVNDSSLQRKLHTENAIVSLEDAERAGGMLLKELKIGSRESILLRSRHDAILNICRILKMNLDRQKILIDKLFTVKPGNGFTVNHHYLDELDRLRKLLTQSLSKAFGILTEIVATGNEMILLDKLIQTSKKYQKKGIIRLKKLTFTALKDAETAIEGSKLNHDRGAELINEIKRIPDYVEDKNTFALRAIVDMANEGAELALHVNSSSKSQLEFAEKVNTLTGQLHDESLHIRKLVSDKHSLFTKNNELISQVAVIVAVEFFEYLSAMDIARHLKENDDLYDPEVIEAIYDLTAFVENACEDVESVASLNYDMTEAVAVNAKIEEKTVELTQKETGCFDMTRHQVMLMTEKTRFPIDGSARNIENGRKVSDYVQRLLDSLTR
ncbi:MAG: hypothetical protein JXK07_01535 [Spirochaetes bacterium]|nr:hypothetical protein [Spirochaetota bacterium]MBN2772255.1 hypothetical protein [Spirochaetota bacterium]